MLPWNEPKTTDGVPHRPATACVKVREYLTQFHEPASRVVAIIVSPS